MRQEDLPKANAKCVICGNPYYMCKKCIELRDRGIYGWKLYCDGVQCYQMKIVLDDYIEKRISKSEAVAQMDSIVFYPERPSVIGAYKDAMDEINSKDVCENAIAEPVNSERPADDISKVQSSNRKKQIKNAKMNRKH